MRDDPTLVEQIQRELQDVRWLGPEEIRTRARRRSQRRIVVATVVLALAGVSAAAVAAPRTSSPPALPVASASPTRHEITTDALLQVTDLQQSANVVWLSQSGLGEPVRLDPMLDSCRASQGYPEGRQISILSRSQTLLKEDRPGTYGAGEALLTQDLYRLVPEAATQLLARMDDLVAPCAEWNSVGEYKVGGATGTGSALHRWTVTQRDFAGDGAALLQHTGSQPVDQRTGRPIAAAPKPTSTAVVRVGDLITVLSLGQTGTEPELRRLADVAARRMCAAANPPC
ncbi:hypothetical protein [Micromonospora sp. NPDC005171]|uniref:hypothetical protein n=1 Tax=Micromonospora sp. NPDC005171 TaxID=3156866 RepID=UPI0033B8443F